MFVYNILDCENVDWETPAYDYMLLHDINFTLEEFNTLVQFCMWHGIPHIRTAKGTLKSRKPNNVQKTIANLKTMFSFQSDEQYDCREHSFAHYNRSAKPLIVNIPEALRKKIDEHKTLLTLEIPEDEYFLILEACLKTRTSIDDFIAEAIRALLVKEVSLAARDRYDKQEDKRKFIK
jgi:hypothetical protein